MKPFRGCSCCLALVAAMAFSPPMLAGNSRIFLDTFESLPGFTLQSPAITVAAGTTSTHCVHFRTPNSAAWGVRRFASMLGAGVTHAILYTTYDGNWAPVERQPAGTVQSPCGLNSGAGTAAWLYAAHDPDTELRVPDHDGAGNLVAIELMPDQPAVLQLRINNPEVTPLTTSATLDVEAHRGANPYTRSATYRSENISFSVPAASSVSAQATCAVPAGARFWGFSTRTHRFGTDARITNAGNPVVISSDWEHPSVARFDAPAFFQFGAGGMTYACTWFNTTNSTLRFGEDESVDETCIGIGYFLPAVRPAICVNSTGPLR